MAIEQELIAALRTLVQGGGSKGRYVRHPHGDPAVVVFSIGPRRVAGLVRPHPAHPRGC